MLFLAAEALLIARQVLAAAERVMQRRHLEVDVLIEVFVGDDLFDLT